MGRRFALGFALTALASATCAPPGEARVAPVKIATVPPVPGARIVIDGTTRRTDSKGKITVQLPGVHTDRYRFHIHPQDRRLGRGVVARFSRWYGHSTLTYNLFYRLHFSFHDLASNMVDPNLVTSMTLKSRTGVRTNIAKGASVWLQGSRVVPFSGKLVSKDIDYQVEKAFVDGANVVNRAQQRFTPAQTTHLAVQLLFYSLTVTTRDALFGFPVGDAVEFRYPSGRTVKHDLKDGRVVLPSLPRGTYDLKVAASGVSFTRPVSLSRNQTVELKVISYLDMVLAVGALLALAVGLVLARRPHLVRALKRRLRIGARENVGAGRG